MSMVPYWDEVDEGADYDDYGTSPDENKKK